MGGPGSSSRRLCCLGSERLWLQVEPGVVHVQKRSREAGGWSRKTGDGGPDFSRPALHSQEEKFQLVRKRVGEASVGREPWAPRGTVHRGGASIGGGRIKCGLPEVRCDPAIEGDRAAAGEP